MYLADTLSRHFIKDQPTKSRFEEEFDQVPLNEQINQIITTEEKMSELKVETEKDEASKRSYPGRITREKGLAKPNIGKLFSCAR